VSAVRLDGIDAAGHLFLRYAVPSAFGDVTESERQRLGQVLDRQYAAVDAQLGRLVASFTPEDLLLVVSGFGMEPVSPLKRLLARVLHEAALSGTHEGAPAGFLIAYGAGIAPGRRPVGAIVDVTPTLLYLLGLPVARDMSGSARTDLFTREFTARRPVTFIPSYDE
jgi:arylsulfatase A-like enzyme